MDHAVVGRQIAAARALLGLGQAELAERSRISVPTLKRMEASDGIAAGLANNVAAVRAALESAGVEFIPGNGSGPGVRLRKHFQSHEDLTRQIEAVAEQLPHVDPTAPPSPKKAMRQLERARVKNEVTKLKNRRTRLESGVKK